MKYFLFFSAFVSFTLQNSDASGCRWDMERKPQKNARTYPIYLKIIPNKYEPFVPNDSYITMENNQEIRFLCPGRNNKILLGEYENMNSTLDAQCSNGKLNARGIRSSFSFFNVECESSVDTETFQNPEGLTCAQGQGDLFYIGYRLPNNFNTLKVIEVCFNQLTKKTIYSKHTLYGSTRYADSSEQSWREDGLTPNAPYMPENFKKTLIDTLGPNNGNVYSGIVKIERGHMAPHRDFIFENWQYASYSLINAAPQLSSTNNGNWKLLENKVRDEAYRRKKNLEIYTGNLDVQQLYSDRGHLVDIYLLNGYQMPFPKWIWKAIYTPERTGIVFVLDNSFLGSNPPNLTDKCNQTGWIFPTLGNTGKIYCYDVNEFSTVLRLSLPVATGIINRSSN